MEKLKMHRYPGIQPFTKDQKRIFKGRAEEKKELISLVKIFPITVLYAKSGIGKSSLIQAGVQPELENNVMMPLFIRLNLEHLPPEVQFYNHLVEQGFLSKDTPDNLTMWEYLKKARFVRHGMYLTPLLIFDQFEELFTAYNEADRLDFMKQFAEIANGGIPEEYAIALDKRKDSIHPQQYEALMKPLDVKILLSLRSDMLHYLDGLSDYVPGIFRCLYELKPLNEANALDAICGPAQELDTNYQTPPFKYSDAATAEIIAFLQKKSGNTEDEFKKTKEENFIESSNLQVVCSRIEQLVINERKTNPKLNEVTPALYGGKEGLDKIIDGFYKRTVDQFPDDREEIIRNTIEKGLMKNERRLSMEKAYLIDEFGITEEELLQLVDSRLLRKEPRMGSDYYEISHDTLIAPINRSYLINKEAEERNKEAEEKLKEAERLNAIKEKRTSRIIKRLGIASIFLAIAAVGFGLWAIKQQKEAKRQEKIALYEKHIADSLRSLAEFSAIESDSLKVLAVESEKLAIKSKNEADSLRNVADSLLQQNIFDKNIAKASAYIANNGFRLAKAVLLNTRNDSGLKKVLKSKENMEAIRKLEELCRGK